MNPSSKGLSRTAPCLDLRDLPNIQEKRMGRKRHAAIASTPKDTAPPQVKKARKASKTVPSVNPFEKQAQGTVSATSHMTVDNIKKATSSSDPNHFVADEMKDEMEHLQVKMGEVGFSEPKPQVQHP